MFWLGKSKLNFLTIYKIIIFLEYLESLSLKLLILDLQESWWMMSKFMRHKRLHNFLLNVRGVFRFLDFFGFRFDSYLISHLIFRDSTRSSYAQDFYCKIGCVVLWNSPLWNIYKGSSSICGNVKFWGSCKNWIWREDEMSLYFKFVS